MVPLSMRYARNASQAPPSGSSPTQHGQGALQEQASKSEPWTRYLDLLAIGHTSIARSGRSNNGPRAASVTGKRMFVGAAGAVGSVVGCTSLQRSEALRLRGTAEILPPRHDGRQGPQRTLDTPETRPYL